MSSHASAINADTTERAAVDKKSMWSIRDGPSLKDFLSPSVIDISSEKPVPYVQNIRGENQKGFSNI